MTSEGIFVSGRGGGGGGGSPPPPPPHYRSIPLASCFLDSVLFFGRLGSRGPLDNAMPVIVFLEKDTIYFPQRAVHKNHELNQYLCSKDLQVFCHTKAKKQMQREKGFFRPFSRPPFSPPNRSNEHPALFNTRIRLMHKNMIRSVLISPRPINNGSQPNP